MARSVRHCVHTSCESATAGLVLAGAGHDANLELPTFDAAVLELFDGMVW
ncbi:MAG TPA: hypothetical protein VKI64_02650 [Acidimicrobiales bacterium]|nr:hypothetical protein [Acidimicrobiales bacterium]